MVWTVPWIDPMKCVWTITIATGVFKLYKEEILKKRGKNRKERDEEREQEVVKCPFFNNKLNNGIFFLIDVCENTRYFWCRLPCFTEPDKVRIPETET